jgi:16S rRNA processing protein RimM
LEITPTQGGPSVLLPFTKAMVPEINIARGRVVIDPPAGTFGSSEPEGGE